MTVSEMCIRSYRNSGEKQRADYNAFELVGYYLQQRPGVETVHLKKDIADSIVQEGAGYTAMMLLERYL